MRGTYQPTRLGGVVVEEDPTHLQLAIQIEEEEEARHIMRKGKGIPPVDVSIDDFDL